MINYKQFFCVLGIISISTMVASANDGKQPNLNTTMTQNQTAISPDPLNLTVYKSPTCGCCENWIEHVQKQNFTAVANHPHNLSEEKNKRGIQPVYWSCHTAVSPGGFVFEGHVPAKLIRKFLDEKPKGGIGLAVPGMPMGSPGMEFNDNFTPYKVLLLKADGSSEVYASVQTAKDQY